MKLQSQVIAISSEVAYVIRGNNEKIEIDIFIRQLLTNFC